jgi:Protein of unknown function (DUF3102)
MTAVLVTEEIADKLIAARAASKGAKQPPVETAVPGVAPPGTRDLADVEKDIAALVKVQRKNIFALGALLIEAKAKVAHGDWLPWLKEHFAQGESTAQNYMHAARYLAKFPTVGNLRLSMRAIYWLAPYSDIAERDEPVMEQSHNEPAIYSYDKRISARGAVAEILKAAKTSYVDYDFCVAAHEKHRRKQFTAQGAATRAENKAKALFVGPLAPTKAVAEQEAIRQRSAAKREGQFDGLALNVAPVPTLEDILEG